MSTVIKIDYIRIKNFKGIESFLLKLGGESATVTGENASGKTTLADAWFWLMTGSNLDQKSNFNVISLDETGNPVDKLDASVEAGIWLGSRNLNFKKVYKQKWFKKAGSIEPVFGGYTTEHFIDDEPMSMGAYLAQCNEIIDPQIFRALSDPMYFCARSKADWRREILFDLCGTITDDQIYDLYTKFKPIQIEVTAKGTSHAAYRKICKKKQKDIQQQLTELPAMIRALKESAPDISGINEAELRKQLEAIDTKISDQRNNIDRIKRQKRIALLESELVNVETKAKKELAKLTEGNDAGKLYYEMDQNQRDYENLEYRLKELIKKREQLIEHWKYLNSKIFKPSIHCYACGQELPEDQVALQKHKFNQEKADE